MMLNQNRSFGCNDPNGDWVSDTPTESDQVSTNTCPNGRDSCPKSPGLDPIHNYMDYTGDDCKNQFTNGQYQRMVQQYNFFRAATFYPQYIWTGFDQLSFSSPSVNDCASRTKAYNAYFFYWDAVKNVCYVKGAVATNGATLVSPNSALTVGLILRITF
ncbi:hypothetical protein BCR33DRAFT_816285 [Rhizoclosmatium globosum]|uniref:Peptidase M43 pregnancy-associated plasma-A domain-containing protein n=1 Tax=Rhizoclosmatium globosum TaxID=329046 RepID=A0A1Y2AFV9_9FUNG|nr:hypothetical protein BCR33DRAFT_816285 [Rhizoclosmatium globosum]|eukprot:ORY21342.1 hypothetical protein BCR33DRAFT_816285 [Rhizoclosmatium globosum]